MSIKILLISPGKESESSIWEHTDLEAEEYSAVIRRDAVKVDENK